MAGKGSCPGSFVTALTLFRKRSRLLSVDACASVSAPDLARLEGLLSPEETARAVAMHSTSRRAAFVAGRGRAREILGSLVEIAPQRIAFRTGPHGKPALAGVIGAPEFNLSHTDDVAVLGVCRACAIGVDIETVRDRGADIAARYFAPSEAAALLALPEAERAVAFVRYWSMKEAVVKATGEGLSRPFKSFEVALDPAGMVWFDGRRPSEAAHWRLVAFEVAPGVVGAVALDAGDGHTAVDLVRHA